MADRSLSPTSFAFIRVYLRFTRQLIASSVAVLIAANAAAEEPPAARAAALGRSLAAAEQRLGRDHADLLVILGPLAAAQFAAGDIADAQSARRRAVAIATAAFGEGSVAAVAAMTALAELNIEMRRYLDAEGLLIVARSVLDERHAEDRVTAALLAACARVSLARGAKDRALNEARRAAAIDENTRGKGDGGTVLRALGMALVASEQFDEAERVLSEALALDLAAGGEEGLAAARSLSELGNLYLREKRLAEALPALKQALRIDRGQLAPAHPLIADDLHDLGVAELERKRPAEAVKLFLEAIKLLNGGAGLGTPRVAYTELELARAYRQQGKDKEAQALFDHARGLLNRAEDEERQRERKT
jgi:tetratricopeptide (TPR) repeat protein